MIRTTTFALLISSGLISTAHAESFSSFVNSMKQDALAMGVTSKTFNRATKGLKPDPKIGKLTRKQPELVKPIGQYIESRIGGRLIPSGKGKIKGLKQTMRNLERIYGVDPYVVVGIWGMETGYGRGIGNSNTFRSLATLAWKRYRKDFFRKEFLHALIIMQKEGLKPKNMVSSWAGAMGQTQFIPSSFRKYAVDFNKDGKRDLWGTKRRRFGLHRKLPQTKGLDKGPTVGLCSSTSQRIAQISIYPVLERLGIQWGKGCEWQAIPQKRGGHIILPCGGRGAGISHQSKL